MTDPLAVPHTPTVCLNSRPREVRASLLGQDQRHNPVKPEPRDSLVGGFAVTVLGISCLDLVATISK
jgi:hypothetical protein